jgi:hypothetical protein
LRRHYTREVMETPQDVWQRIRTGTDPDLVLLRLYVEKQVAFSDSQLQNQMQSWKSAEINFPPWLAPYAYKNSYFCARLNHRLGYGCSRQDVRFFLLPAFWLRHGDEIFLLRSVPEYINATCARNPATARFSRMPNLTTSASGITIF